MWSPLLGSARRGFCTFNVLISQFSLPCGWFGVAPNHCCRRLLALAYTLLDCPLPGSARRRTTDTALEYRHATHISTKMSLTATTVADGNPRGAEPSKGQTENAYKSASQPQVTLDPRGAEPARGRTHTTQHGITTHFRECRPRIRAARNQREEGTVSKKGNIT